MICEAMIVTANLDGTPHVAPFGLIGRAEKWVIAPFKQSKTLQNIQRSSRCVANMTDDARFFAGCVTGRKEWPTSATRPEYPPRLSGALAHWELEVEEVEEDEIRPRFVCAVRGRYSHAPFGGYNRAFGAVVEASVIVSRLNILPFQYVETRLSSLKEIVSKSAGPREAEAFHWLELRVSEYRAL